MGTERMRGLVFGANGVRGSAVVQRLLAEGHAVRVIVRDPAGSPWRAESGVEVVPGDLGDTTSLERGAAGMDAAVLHLPLVYDRPLAVGYGRNAVAAARAAGVRRLVYQGNNRYPAIPTDAAGFEIDRETTDLVLASGVPATVLRPTVYLDNLLGPWTAPGIVGAGALAYPIPATAPVSWLSADDAAAAIVAALARPELAGTTLDLGGPEALPGDEVAARLGGVLRREVRYQAIPLDAFEAGLREALGAEAAREIAKLYRWDADHGDDRRNAVDPSPLRAALGIEPTPVEAWARRQNWEAAARRGQLAA